MPPTTAIEWNDEGITHYHAKDYTTAEKYLLKAIELDGTNPTFYKNLGDIYYDSGKKEEGIRNYKTAIKMNGSNSTFLIDFAMILHGEQQDRAALPYLLKALELSPDNEDALTQISIVYHSLNELASATRYSQRLVKLYPKNQTGLFILARSYLDQGNLPLAEKTLTQILDLDPENSRAWFLRSLVFQQQNNIGKAFECCFHAYQRDPENFSLAEAVYSYYEQSYLFGRLFSFVQQHASKQPGISSNLERSLMAPVNLISYCQLGIDFREALYTDSQDDVFQIKAKKSADVLLLIEGFIAKLSDQSQEDPDRPASQLLQALVAFTQSDFSTTQQIVLALYEKLKNEIYYFLAGTVWLMQENYERSAIIWRIFGEIGKNDKEYLLFAAYCAYQLGKLEDAAGLLVKAQQRAPEWQQFFPTVEIFAEKYILDDLYGIGVFRLIQFIKQFSE
jgi:tetratricopeptide (TPR) repeat protein